MRWPPRSLEEGMRRAIAPEVSSNAIFCCRTFEIGSSISSMLAICFRNGPAAFTMRAACSVAEVFSVLTTKSCGLSMATTCACRLCPPKRRNCSSMNCPICWRLMEPPRRMCTGVLISESYQGEVLLDQCVIAQHIHPGRRALPMVFERWLIGA